MKHLIDWTLSAQHMHAHTCCKCTLPARGSSNNLWQSNSMPGRRACFQLPCSAQGWNTMLSERFLEGQKPHFSDSVFMALAAVLYKGIGTAENTEDELLFDSLSNSHLQGGSLASSVGTRDDHSPGVWPHTHINWHRSIGQHRCILFAPCSKI